MKRGFILVATALLCSCGARPKTAADAPIHYAVPVAAGCVAEAGKPLAPRPISETHPADQWQAMPAGVKAQAIAAQAGRRLNYEDRLSAATAGCK